MDLAQQYGFIGYAYGGTAILLTHKNQLKEDGKDDESDSKVSGK